MNLTRRTWLWQVTAGSLTAGLPFCGRGISVADSLIEKIEVDVIFPGRTNGVTWFHPRACMVPHEPSRGGQRAIMTLQTISGSDVFGQVHWTYSDDMGEHWSEAQPIAALGRQSLGEDMEVGVCDVVPEYHRQTRRVLAIGHNVYYERGVLARPQRRRWPVYVTGTADGAWSQARSIEWDDPRATQIFTCGCAQRITLEDGNLVVPISFGPVGRRHRSATTLRCDFDGEHLRVLEAGNELRNQAGRGLLEPTLAVHKHRFYMSLRAEDNRGYVSTSNDGLEWSSARPWSWDDGQPLEMSTTQQRWLSHSESLFLVYTRKADENINVMRWRAPLYMAEVDTKSLQLIRSSERIALPLLGDGVGDGDHVARMGNFHTVAATPDESWITVGEARPNDRWAGDTLLARVRWIRPNQEASAH